MILELLDYRRQVAALYERIRAVPPEAGCADFIRTRDQLFAKHPQSALSPEQKEQFQGLEYFPYNPAYRFTLVPDFDVEPERFEVQLADDGVIQLKRVARLQLPFPEGTGALSLFWITGYGGGLFLPFRDTTNDDTTYGGGRYLLDTIKHADLGSDGKRLVIDFNFAYNPSCAYNSHWDCPLAPFENRLALPVAAGEKRFIAYSVGAPSSAHCA
jgi:uncharacterized protein (DUF1684 family)